MDEFNKIKELSNDIIGRKEPTFEKNFPEDETDGLPFKDMNDSSLELDTLIEKKSVFHKWGLISLGAFIALLAVGTISAFVFWGEAESDEIITISPTPTPVRIEPENPGGAVIPDVDKQIYNRINPNAEAARVEKLFPEPEKPVLPEILIKQVVPEEKFVPLEEVKGIRPFEETEAVKTSIVIVEEEPVAPKKEVLVLPTAQKKTTSATKTVKKEEKTTGKWRVQLVSSSKKASAEKAWADISKKHKALLSDMSHEIVSATISGKGTFYRLQVGQFASRDMAVSLCSKLKARKQECVPVQVGK